MLLLSLMLSQLLTSAPSVCSIYSTQVNPDRFELQPVRYTNPFDDPATVDAETLEGMRSALAELLLRDLLEDWAVLTRP